MYGISSLCNKQKSNLLELCSCMLFSTVYGLAIVMFSRGNIARTRFMLFNHYSPDSIITHISHIYGSIYRTNANSVRRAK